VGSTLHLTAGSTAEGPYTLSITPELAGWARSGLCILELEPGAWRECETAGAEVLVLPLAGAAVVECEGSRLELAGRPDVFSGLTDFAYLPPGTRARIWSRSGGRFALPSARAARRLPVRHGPASGVPVELRGAGHCSRQVNNFCIPGAFEADRLIACEVLTPAGNWSSYPPHKHDEECPGETALEEIYYFEIAPAPGGAHSVTARPGFGFQRVYGTPERPIDVLAEVRTGDAVLIPHGWHGPSMAAPGYDMYYLNVMAGPGAERAWLVRDDPAHSWVRQTWPGQPTDPRLPMGTAR
jgi:5-deoxy-glucuronate isomerase